MNKDISEKKCGLNLESLAKNKTVIKPREASSRKMNIPEGCQNDLASGDLMMNVGRKCLSEPCFPEIFRVTHSQE